MISNYPVGGCHAQLSDYLFASWILDHGISNEASEVQKTRPEPPFTQVPPFTGLCNILPFTSTRFLAAKDPSARVRVIDLALLLRY